MRYTYVFKAIFSYLRDVHISEFANGIFTNKDNNVNILKYKYSVGHMQMGQDHYIGDGVGLQFSI